MAMSHAPLLLGLSLLAPGPTSDDGTGWVAVQAGEIHLVEGGQVVEDGTILVHDGRIVAVGADVEIPRGVRVVDYGPDAVLVPGLVSADSTYGSRLASERTASPTLLAVDNFDPYTKLRSSLRSGVTSVYLAPARGRLVAGQGAVVKTSGEEDESRVLSASSMIHGSIAAEARRTPGYWVPPVPATVDVGLGVEQPQLPRTTMGAVVALGELLSMDDAALVAEYGVQALEFKPLIAAGQSWRMGAGSRGEVRALLEFFAEHKLPLVLDSDFGASDLAEEIAAASVPVITAPQGRRGADFGKGQDVVWPDPGAVAKLFEAGVRVALVPRADNNLLMAAAIARRGGVSTAAALRAVTLTPAELLGVSERVGSLVPGKDADFAVFNGEPLEATSSILATWVEGEVAYETKSKAIVLEVEELHLGDGRVLRPGQLLMEDGRLAEVGDSVAHPPGATVVRGVAAMPGMIDALGYLGLEGSTKSFSSRFDLRRIVEPGDRTDRRVAQGGVTTVNLGSRSASSNSPTMAYKPAGEDPDRMVVEAPASLRLVWTNRIRTESGESVRKTLKKAADYKKKWEEYEEAIAKWTPPGPEAEEDEESAGEDEEDEDEDEDAEEDEEEDEDKKKKRKKGEKAPARPVTGEWSGMAKEGEDERSVRLRLRERDLELEGTLRVEGLDELVSLAGAREEYSVSVGGMTSSGPVTLSLELDENQLTGKAQLADGELELSLEQVSDVYPVARRPDRTKPPSTKAPKGKPKAPGLDGELEPIRQAMIGGGSVIVSVDREDEVLACVSEFERYGIKPVLWGASGASKVADQIAGRVAGVLSRSSLPALSRRGIPVAFYSAAEEGAVELGAKSQALISLGLSPEAVLRGLTSDAARMLGIQDRVGLLESGLDADVLLLDGSPLEITSTIQRVWVNGQEIR